MFAARGWRSPTSRLLPMRVANVLGAQGWYYTQIRRLADGLAPEPGLGLLRAIGAYLGEELRLAWRRRRAESAAAG
jgi:hypothetical protein